MTDTPAGPRVPPPPDPFDCAIFTLAAGTVLHRIHATIYPGFNPGFGVSRFAPFEIAATKVPTAYAATSLPCALFESLFHDIEPSAPFKSVRWSMIEELTYSTVQLTRDLRLAQLFSADLMKFGIERSQLIDTPRSHYAETRRWSPAAHESSEAPDGMIWVSRRFDEEKALMLFGSRVEAGDLAPVTSVEIATDADCLAAVQDLASRAGILIAR